MARRDFPFTIADVARLLDLNIRHETQASMDVDCPFCFKLNGKKGKMNLDYDKNTYRCNYCDEGGGMIVLYGKLNDIENKDAYREICELLKKPIGKSGNGIGSGVYKGASNVVVMPTETADPETIHQTYSMLLNSLNLTKIHKEHLLNRGLSLDDIEKFRLKSVPLMGQKDICAYLLKSGCTLEGVPGFFYDCGKWNMKLKAKGIVVPVYSIDGKISAMQVRLDNPINDRRYIWLSSKGLDRGATSGAPVHFVGDPAAERVFITEGPLKGNAAHSLTGYTFVCVAGTKSTAKLDEVLAILKMNGTKKITEAYDIDKLTNDNVKKDAIKLRQMLAEQGFKVTSAQWSNKNLKGIDDYYLHRWLEKQKYVYDVDNLAV